MWVDNLADINVKTTDPAYKLLTAEGALSAALRTKHKELSVEVISQQLTAATQEEQFLLKISENKSFIREVFLLGDSKKIVQARVVAPLTTYLSFKETLDTLGNKLLGETLIYKHPYTKSRFQYSRIANTIARRSIFNLLGHHILVQESFLA